MDDFGGPELSFDIDEQRRHVAAERWREHLLWCERMASKQHMNVSDRGIAMKILVNEAFQRDIQRCRREFRAHGVSSLKLTGSYTKDRSPEERLQIEIDRIKYEWSEVARAVAEDMDQFDLSSIVLKHLSCMCVFIPGSICREYGENAEARRQRVENMSEVIARLHEEGKLFLDESPALEISPSKSASVSPSMIPRRPFFCFDECREASEEVEDFGDFICPSSNLAVAVVSS